jgi:hypothetical protein
VAALSRVPEGLLMAKVTVEVHKIARETTVSNEGITQLKMHPHFRARNAFAPS